MSNATRTEYRIRTSTGAEIGEDRPALVLVADFGDEDGYVDAQWAIIDGADLDEAITEVERAAGRPVDWRDATDHEAIADEYDCRTVLVGSPRLTATLRYYDEYDGMHGDDRGWPAVYGDGDEQRLSAGHGASEDEARAEVEVR